MEYLRLPLVLAFACFLAGLLGGLRLGGPAMALALAAALPLGALAYVPRVLGRARTAGDAHAALAVALAVAGWGLGAQGRAEAAGDCRVLLPDETKVEARGVLAADLLPPTDSTARFPIVPLRVSALRADGEEVAGCRAEVRLRLPRDTPPLLAGTTLDVRGEWWKGAAPVDPSEWPADPAFSGMLLAREARIAAAPDALRNPLLVARGRLEARIHRLFPRQGPLADALLLNRRETMDPELSKRFAASGLIHLLAISGGHVALVGSVLVLLGSALRMPRRRTIVATIALVAVYLALIGAPPSAVRAGIMLGLGLAGLLLQRPHAVLPVVAASALAILAADPLSALDAGFQLSFAGVMGLLVLRPAMMRRLPEAWRRKGWRRRLAEPAVTSLAAFLATAPVAAEHFGRVAPISIVANLPAVPLSSLALVGVGAAVAADPVAPGVATLLAGGAELTLEALRGVVDWAAAVPGGNSAVPGPQWPLWAGVGIAFLVAMDAAGRMRSRMRWTLATGSAGAALLVLPALAPASTDALEIAFLDVGQGDAVAVRTPGDRWVLVDAGVREARFDAGERRVLPYLRARGVRRLEALVLTHPHADHVGGAAAVIRSLRVERVIEPELPYPSPPYRDAIAAALERGVPWTAARPGRTLELDGVRLEFLWPEPDLLDEVRDPNEISAVILVRYGKFTALLTGDATAAAEARLVAAHGAGLRADVLKAGHHGSQTSSTESFLAAVAPELAVISVGRRNDYGLPDEVVLDRLQRRGAAIARTDRDGTVVVRATADGAWERARP